MNALFGFRLALFLLFFALFLNKCALSYPYDDEILDDDMEDDLAKRGAVQFARLVKKFTGRSVRNYVNYGCWCGLRKSSGIPVDQTDRCCRTHDMCLYSTSCSTLQIPTVPYSYRGSTCRARTTCGKELCRCDSAAARCFKAALGSYDRKYKGWPSSKCQGPQK